MFRTRRLSPLVQVSALAVLLGGCAQSSESFVLDHSESGYSATRGRILHVEGLASSKIERLSDGVALTVAPPGCKVDIQFVDEKQSAFAPAGGSILVYGSPADCILQPQVRPEIQPESEPAGRP
jgi:hypothetical protein